MLNWTVRKRTVWLFNSVYLQNVFTNHIFNIYVKTVFTYVLNIWFGMK